MLDTVEQVAATKQASTGARATAARARQPSTMARAARVAPAQPEDPLAGILARAVRQRAAPAGVLQRQAIPHYRDCVPSVTGVPNADELLEQARLRAREYVGAARRALASAPAAGTTYAVALARHFVAPTAADRATIRGHYDTILAGLRVNNFICNSNAICGGEQAAWHSSDDLLHICRPFWPMGRTCRAIILIHEGAHDADVDAAIAGHSPNRGDPAYPAGNHAAPGTETTAGRMQNPDAYAFFAAHIWRGTDTGVTCF